MINGVVIGIVTDNEDPAGMCRVQVEFPVDGDPPVKSTWARMATPMAGKDRGLVMIPEVGTEVVLGFAYQTLTPYILGAVFNGGEDEPPYTNDDEHDDHRRFVSRSESKVDFSDEQGSEKVAIECTSKSKAITLELDDANGTLTAKAKADIQVEAGGDITFTCMTLEISAASSTSVKADGEAVFQAGATGTWEASGTASWKGAMANVNTGSSGSADSPPATPAHKHPPVT